MSGRFVITGSTMGFQSAGPDAIFKAGKEPVMDPEKATADEPKLNVGPARVRPRASTWTWHPRYAKLWWACISVYWSGKLASNWSPALDDLYSSALAGLLNVAFFPLTALMIMGGGFAREWFAWIDWQLVEPTHDQLFPKRSVGGLTDPYSDPLDPRSGSLWIGAPNSRARLFHRKWP